MHKFRKQAEAAQSAKLHRLGAMGSTKAAHKGEHAPRKYAIGGAVSDMGPIGGGASKPRLDRQGRSKPKGKSAGKKGTNVNVIIMSKPDGGDKGPMPPMPMAEAGPPPMMPPGPPPGGPPMPMRASGGRVKRQDGGSTVSEDSKREARAKRAEASDEGQNAIKEGAKGATNLMIGRFVRGMNKYPTSKFGKAVEYGNYGAAATAPGGVAGALSKRSAALSEADRIERGLAKPGEEDRKKGGRVKLRSMSRSKGGRSSC